MGIFNNKNNNAGYILGLWRWPSLFLCLLVISGCGSTPKQSVSPKAYVTNIAQSPYSYMDWPNLSKTYKLSEQHGYGTSDAQRAKPVFNTDVVLIGLTKENGEWKAHIGEDEGGEELAINLATGNVTLLAQATPYTPMLGGQKSPGMQNIFSPDIHAMCFKGLASIIGKDDLRNLCKSNFSYISADYNVVEIFSDAVTSLAQAYMLTKFYKVKFDAEGIKSVLEETKIYEHLVNLAADKYFSEFEHSYKDAMINGENLEPFVEKYARIAQLRNHEYLLSARQQARMFALTTADNIDQLRYVIKRYEGDDDDNLLSQAKIRLQKLVDEETRKAELARAEAKRTAEMKRMESERKKLIAKTDLENWRKNLRLGDDTFCGRIIEANSNSTMFKLALSAKLPGYSSEQWINVNDLYQPWRGCLNRNGNLSPQYN